MLKRISSLMVSVFLLVALFEVISIKPALAYIDAGSASMIFQMLAAGVLASLFSIKIFWRRIVAGISNLKLKFIKSAKEND